MVVSPGGWKGPAMPTPDVLESRIRPGTNPIGSVKLTCPTCSVPRQVSCYRLADGMDFWRMAQREYQPSAAEQTPFGKMTPTPSDGRRSPSGPVPPTPSRRWVRRSAWRSR